MYQPDSKTPAPIERSDSTSEPLIPSRRLPQWHFWVPLLAQLMLLVSVPAQSAYTYLTGETVILQTAPVDPYDFLRGYYQVLNYEISDRQQLLSLPGGEAVLSAEGPSQFFLVLEAPNEVDSNTASRAWQPVRISAARPQNLTANQVVLVGQMNRHWGITYGLESYYMPESQRTAVNDEIQRIEQEAPESFLVEVKIDHRGNAVPVGLQVGDRTYRF